MNNIIVKKSGIHGKGVFANRYFKKGEEITSDYSKDVVPKFKIKCNCESENCKEIIEHAD